MIIGAGEMCELAARHFVSNGVSRVLVTNRTFERAEKLAAEFQGRAVPFEEFTDHLASVDIVLTSTGARPSSSAARRWRRSSSGARTGRCF